MIEEYNMAPCRQTRAMMTTFKTKMGEQNYKILNALRHKGENKEKEQEVAEQDNTLESTAASPSRAQDGPAGPSRAQDAGGRPQLVFLQTETEQEGGLP